MRVRNQRDIKDERNIEIERLTARQRERERQTERERMRERERRTEREKNRGRERTFHDECKWKDERINTHISLFPFFTIHRVSQNQTRADRYSSIIVFNFSRKCPIISQYFLAFKEKGNARKRKKTCRNYRTKNYIFEYQ